MLLTESSWMLARIAARHVRKFLKEKIKPENRCYDYILVPYHLLCDMETVLKSYIDLQDYQDRQRINSEDDSDTLEYIRKNL